MNKQLIRFLSLTLCLVMIFSLAACGKTEQAPAPAAENETAQEPAEAATAVPTAQVAQTAPEGPVEYAWKSDFMTISSDSNGAVQPVLYTDDGFYATGQEKIGRMEIPEGQVEEYEGQYDIRCFQYNENDEIVADAILKGDYDPETDTITAEGFFDPDEPITVTFSYDDNYNVVWTEDGESTTMEYSYRTENG